ncbi:MAG: membrane protein insertion efficiency factor YidD [Planctomycetota bacterium]
MRPTARHIARLPARGLVWLVRLYQATLSPILGRQCRFVPTCSEYAIEAIEKRGAIRGTVLGLWRLCRCHPFSRGGYDPVP